MSRQLPDSSGTADIAGVLGELRRERLALTRLLSALAGISESATARGDEADFCTAACDHIVRELQFSFAAIYCISGSLVSPVGAADEASFFDPTLDPLAFATDPPLIGRVQATLTGNDTRLWAASDPESLHRHWVAQPIRHRGSVLGVIAVAHSSAQPIDPEAQAAVRMIARVLGPLMMTERALADVHRDLRGHIADLELARTQAHASELAKSEFLANMSHEIRTPMNGILGMATVMSETELDETQASCLETIMSCAKSLVRLLEDVLDYSRLESGGVELLCEPFDLHQLVRELASIQALTLAEHPVELKVQIDDDVPRQVEGDEVRLRQVISNLLSNAVKFTREGSVTLSLTRLPNAQDRYLIAVTDTGIGIPADKLQSVFERFRQADPSWTREFGGAGLGLAIVHELVNLMGGNIRAESTEGVGSTFTVELPLASSTGAEDAPGRSGHRPVPSRTGARSTGARAATAVLSEFARLRILIADDNRINLRVVGDMLARLRCHVVQVSNGQEALRRARTDAFDLLLLDCRMPDLDGPTVAHTLRTEETSTPGQPRRFIVALTASSDGDEIQRCVDAGIDEVLRKPLIPERLREVLTRALETSAGSPRGDAPAAGPTRSTGPGRA